MDNLGTNLFVYAYDADNRLTNRNSAAKGLTKYSYDDAGNLTYVDYPVSPDITFQYDALNRLTNMLDAVGTTKYAYDGVGQLLSENGPWDDDTVSYTYANRLRTGLSVAAPNCSPWTESYIYDQMERLTNVTSPAGTFGYDFQTTPYSDGLKPGSLVYALSLPNGASITNNYDSAGRMIATHLINSSGTALDTEDYVYNLGGQRTQQSFTAGNYENYTYDSIGELKTAFGQEPGGVTNRMQEQFGYVYDAAGNLNYRTNNTLLQQFNVNSLNELTTVTNGGRLTVAGSTTSPATNVTVNTSNATLYVDTTFASTNQPWSSGNNTYTAIAKDSYGRTDTSSVTVSLEGTNALAYDLNGNLLTNGTRVFEYDDENQLVRITEPAKWKSEFTYDGRMRRRIRKEYSWNGSTWAQTNEVRYIYDCNFVIQERDGNNFPQVTYTHGNDLSGTLMEAGGIAGLLARTDMGAWSVGSGVANAFYHADGNGNITSLIYSNQSIAAKYEYDSYGNILSKCGDLADVNLYRFSTKEYHEASGLVYYLFRYYDANLQRWVNTDPMEEQGGLNLYGFVGNRPIDLTDKFGLFYTGLPVRSLPKPPPGLLGSGGAGAAGEGGTLAFGVGAGPILLGTVCIGAVGVCCIDAYYCHKYPDPGPAPLPLPPRKPKPQPAPKPLCPQPIYPEPPYPSSCDDMLARCIGSGDDCFSCWRECQSTGSWPSYKCNSSRYPENGSKP